MQYLGGKSRLGGHIVAAILADLGIERLSLAVDLCSGGGGVTRRLADVSDHVVAVEYHPGLVNLMRAVQAGWVPPSDLSEEEYQALRQSDQTSPLAAFAGFGCSFGGKLWGGYARSIRKGEPFNYAACNASVLRKDTRRNVKYVQGDAATWISDGVQVVYCDPPYEGTTGYPGAPKLATGTWWRRLQVWADMGVAAYLSEYASPPEDVTAVQVWEAPTRGGDLTRGTKTERLWRVLGFVQEWDAALEREEAD